jgi:hypothetical protein
MNWLQRWQQLSVFAHGFATGMPRAFTQSLDDFGALEIRVVHKALSFRFIAGFLVAAIAKRSIFCKATCANKYGFVLRLYFNWTSCAEADDS